MRQAPEPRPPEPRLNQETKLKAEPQSGILTLGLMHENVRAIAKLLSVLPESASEYHGRLRAIRSMAGGIIEHATQLLGDAE